MPTRNQIIAIQKARRQLGLSDPQYRMILRNTGRADSSTELDNRGVEDVMAVLEDMGFDAHPGGKTYWRDKVARRNSSANERQVELINKLAPGSRYQLPALCERFSGMRASSPDELAPGEAWKLIEMLKAEAARSSHPRSRQAEEKTHLRFWRIDVGCARRIAQSRLARTPRTDAESGQGRPLFFKELHSMITANQITRERAVDSLYSDLCPACGGHKQEEKSLCFRCFSKLPGVMQKALYAHVGRGYEPAVQAAMNFLRATKLHLPKGTP